MTPRFLLADSDPDATLPFIVHTRAPQFVALMTPKFHPDLEALREISDLRTALRGVNLYPGFLTHPHNATAEQIMSLFHKGAHYILDNTFGRDLRNRMVDRDVSIIWRDEGARIPKHLLAETPLGDVIVRTEFPRLMVRFNTRGSEDILWKQEANERDTHRAIADARLFQTDYHRRECAA